jgi:hypothetical protein
MNKKNKKDLIDKYISSYNAFDIDSMMSLLHSDIEFKNISNGEETASTSGEMEFRKLAEQSTSLFSSRKQTIESFNVTDEKISVGISYEGVLAVDMPNGLKAGDSINLKGTSMFSFKDGKICKIIDIS